MMPHGTMVSNTSTSTKRRCSSSCLGNYGLMLPVMLAVAVATGLARRLNYGTIYTRKLLRRGIDIKLPSDVGQTQARKAMPLGPGALIEIGPAEGDNGGKQDQQADHDQYREVGRADPFADLIIPHRPVEERHIATCPNSRDHRGQ